MTTKSFKNRIEKLKQKLIEDASINGLYENFGDKEIRSLEKHVDEYSSNADDLTKTRMLRSFKNWCYNYEGGL